MLTSESRFYEFVREERVFAAVLAHLLMQRGANISNFLTMINARLSEHRRLPLDNLDEAEIYVEFSFLRDWWDGLGRNETRSREQANHEKREFIKAAIKRLPSITQLLLLDLDADTPKFNGQLMGKRGLKIVRDIASPHHWSVVGLDALAQERDLGSVAFRDLCKFKWAFNIKPDLVVLLPERTPLCIEAKLESREGFYPARTDECLIFDRRFGSRKGRVKQFRMQLFMFDYLLETSCQPVVIARDIREGQEEAEPIHERESVVLTWAEVFSGLDKSTSMSFVAKLIEENQTLREKHGRPSAPLRGHAGVLRKT
jgi:hypothetical protein